MDMKYWASSGPDKIASEMMMRIESYRKFMEQSGMLRELRKSYDTFYGTTMIEDLDKSLKVMHVNHYASLIRNIHTMVTSQRPAWETRAVNTDLSSQSDTQLASGLLDFYMKEKGLEQKISESVLKALFLREGWLSLDWNATSGEVYGVNPESGEPIREGDVECKTHTILDVIRDVRRRDMNHDWYIVRNFKNKFDLAAKYKEMSDKILKLDSDNRFDIQYELTGSKNASMYDETSCDLVPTYTLYHKQTDSMPQGRLIEICNDEIILLDAPLPYKSPYMIGIFSAKHFETAFGHSYLMDNLPLQDATNMTFSAILTNQAANAVQNFKAPKGSSVKVTNVMDGMNLWEYDEKKGGAIEPMPLLQTAPEVFEFAQLCISQQELLSNVSQIGRGNAPPQMSGTAMALLQQQAIQSTSGVQSSYTRALEDLGSGLIELLQTFAVVPRIAMIVGKSKRSMLKSFSNKDLQGIGKVYVDSANPLTKTGAGRLEIANQLLQTGLISDPAQYLGVLTTGNLEPLYQRDNSQRMLILHENENLMEGKPAIATITDNDELHILEHSCVLDTPEARENPEVVQAVTEHIQQHIDQAKAKDPALAQMLKQTSYFQQPPPMGPMPPPDQGVDPAVMNNENPVTQQASQTQLPSPAQPPNPNAFGGQ